jgi:hypothetical protein
VPAGGSAADVYVAGTAPPEEVDVTVNADRSLSSCKATKA